MFTEANLEFQPSVGVFLKETRDLHVLITVGIGQGIPHFGGIGVKRIKSLCRIWVAHGLLNSPWCCGSVKEVFRPAHGYFGSQAVYRILWTSHQTHCKMLYSVKVGRGEVGSGSEVTT